MASSVDGTYIAYATADNGVADDNPADGNGLFTKLLLTALRTPGLDLNQTFQKTRQDVYSASQKTQRPFIYDGVIGQFYFIGPVTINLPPVPVAPTKICPGLADADGKQERMRGLHRRIRRLEKRSAWKQAAAPFPSPAPMLASLLASDGFAPNESESREVMWRALGC